MMTEGNGKLAPEELESDGNRYFACVACGQVVQGWNASQDITCCSNKHMVEMSGATEIWAEHIFSDAQWRREHGLRP